MKGSLNTAKLCALPTCPHVEEQFPNSVKSFMGERANLKERVATVSAVCLTTDCWTSRTTKSHMAVSYHFIENFQMSLCLLNCFEMNVRHTAENLAQMHKNGNWRVK